MSEHAADLEQAGRIGRKQQAGGGPSKSVWSDLEEFCPANACSEPFLVLSGREDGAVPGWEHQRSFGKELPFPENFGSELRNGEVSHAA